MNDAKRAFGRVSALALGLSVVGCAASYQADVVPPGGALFAQIKAPLTTSFNGNATGAGTSKTSRSATKFVNIPIGGSWTFSWDEAAIGKIAADAGMTSVSYADYEFFNILGLWETFTVNVYGN